MVLKKVLLLFYLGFILFYLVGCKGDVIASTSVDKGMINVYKSGAIYKYEYVVYDTEKEKDVVIEKGRVKSLSELEEQYGVSFSYTD